MARLLLFKAGSGETQVIECDGLQDYYNALECDCFDIATRRVGTSGKVFDIFCDDVGLFVEHPIVSMVNVPAKQVELVGNLIFANHDADGNTTSLSDDEIEYIRESIITITKIDPAGSREFLPVIACV